MPETGQVCPGKTTLDPQHHSKVLIIADTLLSVGTQCQVLSFIWVSHLILHLPSKIDPLFFRLFFKNYFLFGCAELSLLRAGFL